MTAAPLTKSTTATEDQAAVANVPWNPWGGLAFVIVVFVASQIIAGVFVGGVLAVLGYNTNRINTMFTNSTSTQFFLVLLAEALTLGAIYRFVRHYKLTMASIGLKRPRLRDVGYGIAFAPLYYIGFGIVIVIAKSFIHDLDLNQAQDIGFNHVHGVLALSLTFISLVILPPITEEIVVRGFLYSSLKKALPVAAAVIITSLIFAAAHLPEGGSGGLLYVGAIDTFVLSLFLIRLREQTGGLWASITLHAIKNGVAFAALYLF